MSKKITIFGLLVMILLIATSSVSSVEATPSARSYAACRSSAWLRPMERPGHWWEEHRHWLEAPFPFNGGRYTIIN